MFGTILTPFCAGFAPRRSASDWGQRYEVHATGVLRDNFYFDACLLSWSAFNYAKAFAVHIRVFIDIVDFSSRKWVCTPRKY